MNNFVLIILCILQPLLIIQISSKVIVKRASSSINCGVAEPTSVSLIFGGNSIARKEHPWRVALIRNTAGSWKYICGGVLVDKNVVITGESK